MIIINIKENTKYRLRLRSINVLRSVEPGLNAYIYVIYISYVYNFIKNVGLVLCLELRPVTAFGPGIIKS